MKFNPFKDGFKNKMKEVLHPKNIWKQAKEHKTWAITGIAGVVTTSVVVPTAVILTQEKIEFDGHTFGSASELANYLQEAHLLKTIDKDNAFSLELGDEKRYFTSPSEVYEFLKTNNIKTSQAFSSKALTRNSYDEEIVNYPIMNDNKFLRTIYQGNNDSYFIDGSLGIGNAEDEAIKSYLQMHQIYYFNDKLFKNQADLKKYITDKLFDQSKTGKQILISGKNRISLPVNTTNITDDFLKQFLISEADLKLDFHDGLIPHTVSELKANPSLIPDEAVPFYQIQANSGQSSYIIDMDENSPGSLVGPYLYTTSNNPTGLITSKDQWQQTSTSAPESNVMSQFNVTIMDTMTNFVFEDSELNNFFVFMDNPETNSDFLNQFSNRVNDFKQLKNKLSNITIRDEGGNRKTLLAAAQNIQTNLLRGKKSSVFKTIVFLRTWMINQMIDNNVDSSLVYDLSLYFDYLVRVMGFRLENQLGDLLSDEAAHFDFGRVFNFVNNRSFNIEPGYYIDNILSGRVEQTLASANTMYDEIPEATEIFLASFAFTNFQLGLLKQANEVNKSVHNSFPFIDKASLYNIPSNIGESKNIEEFKAFSAYLSSYQDFASRASNPTFGEGKYDELITKINIMLSVYHEATIKINENILISKPSSFTYIDFSNVLFSILPTIVFTAEKLTEFAKAAFDVVLASKTFSKLILNSSKVFDNIMTFAQAFKDQGKFLNTANKILKMKKIAAGLSIFAIALDFISDLVMGIIGQKVQDFYTWGDSAQGSSFVWTGGSHVDHSFLFWSWETDKVGLEALDIITPSRINAGRSTDGYYYGIKSYPSIDDTKKAWINNLSLQNLASSPSLEVKLSIDLKPQDKNILNDITITGSSYDELAQKIIARSGELFHDIYINEAGLVTTKDASTLLAIDEILAKINPFWVAQLPIYENFELKTSPYIMPHFDVIKVDGTEGLLNDDANKYWFINSNLNLDKQSIISLDMIIRDENQALKYFVDKFKENYIVNSKLTTIYDIIHASNYSEVQEIEVDKTGSPILIDVFETKIPSGEVHKFTNLGSAQAYLLGTLHFEHMELLEDLKIYGYNDHEYQNLDDFVQAVLTGGIYE